jgi:hypothetical protein
MALEDTNQIDAIGLETSSNNVVLTLIDATDWTNESEHLHFLQDKLNSYLRFLESGEIMKEYPDANTRHCLISVVAQYKPTENGLHFLNVACSEIEQAGFGFRFELRQADSTP